METFQFTLVYIVANFLMYMLVFAAVLINCETRFTRWLTIIVGAVSFAGYAAINLALPVHSTIRVICACAWLILVAELLFKGRWLYKLVAILASLFALILSDLFLAAIMPRDEVLSGELMQRHPVAIYTVVIFINLVLQSITVVFVRVLIKKSRAFNAGFKSVLILAFPVSQFITLMIYCSNYANTESAFNPWQIIPVVLIYILADVAMVFSLRMAENSARTQARNALLEEQIAFQKDYYAQLGSSYEQIRKMRHDIDNHMYSIRALLDEGHTDEARQYASEMTSPDKEKTLFPSCENTVAASFIEKRKEDLEKAGIDLKCNITMPAHTGISNPDLICAFGNILDNAQEACEGISHPGVVFNVNYKMPYLSISCENSVDNAAKEHRKRIPELERGLGMVILEDLANQYDGELRIGFDGDMFRTTLILKGQSV